MKAIAIIMIMMLSGCVVPVTQKFPKAPDSLLAPTTELIIVPHGSTPTVIVETVNENYSIYHETAARLRAWQTWYTDQKKIFEKIQ